MRTRQPQEIDVSLGDEASITMFNVHQVMKETVAALLFVAAAHADGRGAHAQAHTDGAAAVLESLAQTLEQAMAELAAGREAHQKHLAFAGVALRPKRKAS